jgi:hypothetical protein
MNVPISNLYSELIRKLSRADEIWMAVGLINHAGLKLILENVPADCKQNYLVGVDMPSDPKALRTLFELEKSGKANVRINTKGGFFHPKVYLVKKGGRLLGFVGSANCTSHGFSHNIEMTVPIEDERYCGELLKWFNDLYGNGGAMTKGFLKKYETAFEKRKSREREEVKIAKDQKEELEKDNKVLVKKRDAFIKILKKYRASPDYNSIVRTRRKNIESLRQSLDYPTFTNIDFEEFYKIDALGHIVPIGKPYFETNIGRFRKLMKFICNERVGIIERFDEATEGDMRMYRIEEGIITKVLAMHNPQKFYVRNSITNSVLNHYGFEFSKGMTRGEKYELACKELMTICQMTGIPDLGVLDLFIWMEGERLGF